MRVQSIALLLGIVVGAAPHTERDFQEYANSVYQGILEYRLKDNTRVDILVDDYAIEVDFITKWYEGIGQAAHYARMTNKRPAVLLIIKEEEEEKYIPRIIQTSRRTWVRIKLNDGTFEKYSVAVFFLRKYEL